MQSATCGIRVREVSEQLPAALIGRMGAALWVALDCLAAAFLLGLSVHGALGRVPEFGAPTWLEVLAGALVAAPVAVRRSWPVAAFAVVLAANTVLAILAVGGNPAIMVALTLYTVAVSRPLRRSFIMLAGALVVSTTAEAVPLVTGRRPLEWQAGFDVIAASVLAIAAAWALGAAMRAQRLYAARTAEQLTRRAVDDERLRIARELHDVITHSMSLITVKASVANYLIDSRPEEVRVALSVIEATGRRALTDMRRMLGVLRAGGDAATSPDFTHTGDERAPAPGLDDLAALAGHAAEAGVHVRLDVRGEHALPDGVALSAYRIVQEALTNVIKHAAPAHCHVQVDVTDEDIAIDVTDDGNGRRTLLTAADGHGIIGMRERVSLYGGEFDAGPVPHGGYRVMARLPIGSPQISAPADRKHPT